jgi:hypothetical protein
MKSILFYTEHFEERGTEVAIYDYARYNEEILKNKSYIICLNTVTERTTYQKFANRFQIIEIDKIADIRAIIEEYSIDFFYSLEYGTKNEKLPYDNKAFWGNCKTIKHCVFYTAYPESDYYISISHFLNERYRSNIPVLPHIVSLPFTNENMREELTIPQDAIVYGRYGGYAQFDLPHVHKAIRDFFEKNKNANVYFLFMNTEIFFTHPRVIYLEKNVDLLYKSKFIQTCDAMIHGRTDGETFGLSIAEFSIFNKPIITTQMYGSLEHVKILRDKGIYYSSTESLLDIFNNFSAIKNSRSDWNAYQYYTPENIMKIFDDIISGK